MTRARGLRNVGLCVLLIALIWICSRIDFGKARSAFAEINWGWALLVLVLNVVNTWIEAVRLATIVAASKAGARVSRSFESILVGVLWNSILPLRAGDGVRAYYLARREDMAVSTAISAVMLDRFMEFAAFVFLLLCTALLFPLPAWLMERTLLIATGVIAAVFAVGFILLALGRYWGRQLGGRGSIHKFTEEMNRCIKGLALLKKAGLLLPTSTLSLLSWLTRAIMVWAMFRAFHLSLPYVAAPVTLILMNIGIAVVSTPANVGGFEVATVAALRFFSVDTEVALSYALVLHIIEVVPMVALGFVVFSYSGFKSTDVEGQ